MKTELYSYVRDIVLFQYKEDISNTGELFDYCTHRVEVANIRVT